MWAVFFMRRPVQRKYAAKAAHGPRGEQGEKLPCPIPQARAVEIAADAACAPPSGRETVLN